MTCRMCLEGGEGSSLSKKLAYFTDRCYSEGVELCEGCVNHLVDQYLFRCMERELVQ